MNYFSDPDYRALHLAWATIHYARTSVNPELFATELDWHFVQTVLAERLTAHGAEMPPTPPKEKT
jgi:hypothetical protein